MHLSLSGRAVLGMMVLQNGPTLGNVLLCVWYLEALGMSHTHTRSVALFLVSCVYPGCQKQVHSSNAVVASPANFTGLCEYIPKRLRMFVCLRERQRVFLPTILALR